MIVYIHKLIFRILACLIILTFSVSSVMPPHIANSQTVLNLPRPGSMVTASSSYYPANIVGITLKPKKPFELDFIIDVGDDLLQGEELRKESNKLISYFLAALTVPEEDMWVNLSPYEENHIIAKDLSQTLMGRDMLAQDYILKQLTASFMYPENDLGRAFWNKIYEQVEQKYGTQDIPINTFNKVWIVPEKAVVFVQGLNVFVAEARLKVMLEEDYIAMQKSDQWSEATGHKSDLVTDSRSPIILEKQKISTEILKELIIPAIEREINEGKHFAPLRQIYHSLILAAWYKKNLNHSILTHAYVDQNKIVGIDLEDKEIKDKIYQQYLKAFKIGVYNYIKEDCDPATQEIISRKYFSGGEDFAMLSKEIETIQGEIIPAALLTRAQEPYVRVYFKGNPVGSDSTAFHYLEVINDVIKTVKASEPNGTDVLRITDSAMIESEKVPISYDGVRFASDSTILDSAKYLLMVLRKAGYISQYGIDDSNFKDEQGKASIKNLSKNDLLYPEGVNVAIFARRNLGIQLLAYWAASGYIEGLNVLLISSKDSIIFDEDGGKRVYATDAVFLDKELNLVYGRFDKPVPIHTVAHSDNDVGDFHRKLDDFEIPTLSSIRSMELTTDKIKFGRYLQEQKFLTPDFIVIDRGTSAITVRSRLQEFFDRQKEKFGNEEIVIKPPSEFASEGVGMFSSDEIKQAVEHVISLYSWSDKIMVQERVSNKLWTNKNGDIIDYNFRVLSTWDQDEVIVTEDMIEIRYQPIGKDPVSKVKGASVMTLKQYYEAIGIDENDRKSFSARLIKLIKDVTHSMEESMSDANTVGRENGFIGWDVLVGQSEALYLLEANSNNAGGILTLESLFSIEKKGNVVRKLGKFLYQSATNYKINLDVHGGIDFNLKNVNLEEQGDNIDILFDNSIMIDPQNLKGIEPVIINILPITSFHQLLAEGKRGR